MPVYSFNHSSDLCDRVQQQIDITYIRQVADNNWFAGQDRCGDQGKRGILGAADVHYASQRFSASDEILFHKVPRKVSLLTTAL